MMICGFQESSVLLSVNIAILLTIGGVNGFTVIRSTTWNGDGDVDRFSNPVCQSWKCAFTRSACSTADCCFCQCAHRTPNYLMNPGTCRASDEIDESCQFSTSNGDDAPLSVNEMTKAGQVQFWNLDAACNGMQVTMWHYRSMGGSWLPGSPNVFRVANVPRNVHSWTLQWNRGLDAKYTGLIMKIDFSCENIPSGCLLMKSKGNYTFANTVPSDVAVDARGEKTWPTLQSVTSAGTNKTNEGTNQVGTAAKTKLEVEAKQTGIVIAGVTVSLAAGIVLVLATLLLTMKRRREGGRTKGQRRKAPNVAYEEPIRPSARPGETSRTATFQNAFYSSDCVLSISTQNSESTDTMGTRTSRLGPLPPVPSQEGIYEEPVITRNVAYHDLAKEPAENNGTVDNAAASEQQSLPVYNILEPSATDDGDYDDTVDVSRNSDA